jgi:hypothetical protein
MTRFLTGASRAAGPAGLGGMWQWLLAGALAFEVAPVSAQAPDRAPRLAAATLFGLPADNGRVQWPFGLESLTPSEEAKALRDQLELVLYFVATQAAEGKVNRVFIDFGLQAVRDLRKLLRQGEGTMHASTYREAMQFLDRAERGLTRIKMMGPGPGGAYPSGAPRRGYQREEDGHVATILVP